MTNHHQPPMHERQIALDGDGTGHAEVTHGANCVALVATDHGHRFGFVVSPDQARRLARILNQQADAAEQMTATR
jgi:hypothetical protein